jgi:Diguanylate cyclase, GGDEF domain
MTPANRSRSPARQPRQNERKSRAPALVTVWETRSCARWPTGSVLEFAGLTLWRASAAMSSGVLAQLHRKEKADLVAKSLLDALSGTFPIDGHEITLSTSIGISISPDDSADPTELLQQADSAMYSAKRDGKNRCLYLIADIGSTVRGRLIWRTMRHSGLKPGLLQTELTESVMLHRAERAAETMKRLGGARRDDCHRRPRYRLLSLHLSRQAPVRRAEN